MGRLGKGFGLVDLNVNLLGDVRIFDVDFDRAVVVLFLGLLGVGLSVDENELSAVRLLSCIGVWLAILTSLRLRSPRFSPALLTAAIVCRLEF